MHELQVYTVEVIRISPCIGCAENLTGLTPQARTYLSKYTHMLSSNACRRVSFELLLDQPFQQAALCRFEDPPTGKVEVSVCDPRMCCSLQTHLGDGDSDIRYRRRRHCGVEDALFFFSFELMFIVTSM